MKNLIWRMLTIGVVGLGVWLVPGVAGAASVGADIVEPSPTNFQSWTFKPGALTVHVGDVVQWRNTGQNAHTVTADNAAFDSGNLAAGAVFSFTFTKPGTYSYACGYHPWMKGTIQVEGAAVAAAPTATSVPPPATRVPTPPTATPPRATPVPPTTTAVPVTSVPATAVPATTVPSPTAAASPTVAATSPSVAAASPTVAATATTVPPTSLAAPATQTTAPTTVTPVSATPVSATTTSVPAVGLVVEPAQTTVPATPPPPISTPTNETGSSLAGLGAIVGGLVALIALIGIGLVVVSRSRGGNRVANPRERRES